MTPAHINASHSCFTSHFIAFPIALLCNIYWHYFTFSVIRYSIYLPSISLVCASKPGSALKKNPATGIQKNSNGDSHTFHLETPAGRGGRCLNSITRRTARNTRVIVRIPDEILGSMKPRAVLLNTGLTRVTTDTPTVIINQFTGQSRLSAASLSILKVLFINDTPG